MIVVRIPIGYLTNALSISKVVLKQFCFIMVYKNTIDLRISSSRYGVIALFFWSGRFSKGKPPNTEDSVLTLEVIFMVYGYARISTNNKHQKLDRQIHELLENVSELEPENIFSDKKTGTNMNREGLQTLKKKLKPGDVVYVTELSRLSRSTTDLMNQIREFANTGVEFHSLKENFDFDTTFGKLILTVLAAVATLERDIIVERVREGVEVARIKGKRIGRPPVNKTKIEDAFKLYDSKEYSVSKILVMTGISRSTFYRALQRRAMGVSLQEQPPTQPTSSEPHSLS